ncbi:unnamed protein product [Allacma fusca]|uniref:Uncharacterized protein n=1 Tax=Allacma fusca TaxID=39272 RepID=A0A8J2JKX4_9HEXA|nr:unnamed protein product [Allacma fusca]
MLPQMKRMPKYFHNLKRNVENHIKSFSHKNAAYKFNPQIYPFDANSVKQEQNSGRVLGRNAFKAVEERLRFTLDEPLPSTLQKRPFAVVADKVTPQGDTLQIVGLIYVQNGKLRPIQLDCRPVSTDLSGTGTAQKLLYSLTRYFTPEELRSRCIGYAFDGQYFHLKVPEHIMNLLNVPAADRDFYSFVHDPVHVIELAGKDARNQRGVGLKIGIPWIHNIVSTITRVSSKCKWGSGWSELKEILEDMKKLVSAANDEKKLRLLRFKRWSDTRFSTYIIDVLESFRNNYPIIHQKLGGSPDLLKSISHATFPMELCSLIDIYNVIGEVSRQVQATYMFPWQVDDAIVNLNDRLRLMEVDMQNTETLPVSWPKFSSCASEILQTSTYPDKILTTNSHVRYASRSQANNSYSASEAADRVLAVRTLSAEHVRAFVENLERRRNNFRPPIFASTRECFAMSDIWSRQNVNAPPSFSDLVATSQRVGLTLEDMESQYRIIAQQVLMECDRLGYNADFHRNRQEETDFYGQILSSSTAQHNFPDVANLLAASVTRTSSESVTESMSSMLKTILRGSEALGLARQRQELFLNWNAPPNNQNAAHINDEALDSRFGGPYWHTHRRAPKRKLKPWKKSKTTERLNDLQGHVSVPGRIRKLFCLE